MNITRDDLDARTAYDLLGLTSSATLTEIRSAYLTLVRLYHPDKQSSRLGPTSSLSTSASSGPLPLPGQGDNEGRSDGGGDPLIVRLNEAYATLSSPEGRAAYDARLLSSSSSHRQQEVGARISATVDLDDFEVKHADELDSGNQASSSAQSQATDLTSVDNKAVQEDDDGSGDEDDAGGSSPIVFVYPCRCGHAFIVHPDELLTTATTSDTTDGIITTNPEGPQISSNDQDQAVPESITTSMSMLSTCPGCSQVIKVVWGHTDDVDDEGETRGEDVQIAHREK
ncbi:hypothetical protein A4X13_0g5518 [Tilletia indica]|uniref:Diphthamide biosynthesis protein 4 n=1 Tax=Tilletia indica TaxID=43049 RepID=A0A177TGF2_9BASI|nr:hypothetical protein A4X13_0g5518 [Tilletia indica]